MDDLLATPGFHYLWYAAVIIATALLTGCALWGWEEYRLRRR